MDVSAAVLPLEAVVEQDQSVAHSPKTDHSSTMPAPAIIKPSAVSSPSKVAGPSRLDGLARTASAKGKALRRGRTGCLTCRQRHLKCDEAKPICERCRKSRRECVEVDPQFWSGRGRRTGGPILRGTPLGRPSNRTNSVTLGFKFVDETSKVASGYRKSSGVGPFASPPPSSVLSSSQTDVRTPSLREDSLPWPDLTPSSPPSVAPQIPNSPLSCSPSRQEGAFAPESFDELSPPTGTPVGLSTTATVQRSSSSLSGSSHPSPIHTAAIANQASSSLTTFAALPEIMSADYASGRRNGGDIDQLTTTTDVGLSFPDLPFSTHIYSLFDPVIEFPEQPALDLSSLLDQVVSHQTAIEQGYNEALRVVLPGSQEDEEKERTERESGDGNGGSFEELGLPERDEHLVSRRIPRGDRLMMILMRHYVEVVGPWLDMTDSRRHFGTIIPERAFSHPVLINAILAFSARHLSRLDSMDGLIAEYYHSECVKNMIPMLQDHRAAASGALLAAMTILRMYEMLEPSGADLQQHLLGSCSLIGVESIYEESDELRKAAFWVLLRQDILWAEKHRRPTIMDLSSCFVTSLDLTSPTSDEMWANRMYYLLAKVINFSFSRSPDTCNERRREEWKELNEAVEKWRQSLPPGFQPFWYAEADEGELNPFPSIWLLSDWHVASVQSYHMARLLLYTHCLSPLPASGSSLGFNGFRFFQRLDEEIVKHARIICGISVTNRCQSARISATQQLALAGKCLRSPREKRMLVQILREIEAETTWPVDTIIEELLRDWGWSSEPRLGTGAGRPECGEA